MSVSWSYIGQEPKQPLSTTIYLAGDTLTDYKWQSEMIGRLCQSNCNIHLYRSDDFSYNLKERVDWELEHLENISAILFWFSEKSFCSTVLYQLGFQLGINASRKRDYGFWADNKAIFVGIHPNYIHKTDVEIQSKFALGEQFQIAYSIQYLTQQIINYSRRLDR